jgi:hypothetical protein
MILHAFWSPSFFMMVSCKDGGEVDVEGYGRLSVHDGSLEVARFVCTS